MKNEIKKVKKTDAKTGIDSVSKEKISRHKLFSLFIQGAILSFANALISYIMSSYLVQYMDEKYINFVYLVPNVISILLIFYFGKIIRKIGLFSGAILNGIILFLSLYLQVIAKDNIVPIVASLIFYQISSVLSMIFIDYYIEKKATGDLMGNIKGTQWSFLNGAFLIGPLAMGILLSISNFKAVFLLAAFVVMPALYLFFSEFKDEKIKLDKDIKIKFDLKKIIKDKAVFKISIISFILHFFYCWMSIYIPIYMNKDLGLGWDQIGIILAIILLPFAIIQYPAGKIADKYLGEKEMLLLGLLLMAISTIALFFVDGIIMFTLFLFITRVGAALVEIMREIYLFKNITEKDIDKLSFYKAVAPFAYIVGPSLASIVLVFFDTKLMFLLLGGVILSGILVAWRIKDTKVNFKSKFLEM